MMEQAIITIQTRDDVYVPLSAEGISLEFCRAGAPGKLTFSAVKDSVSSFHEGDNVVLQVGANVLFSGFVFTKRRQFGRVITVTAYDQIRYLKNRDTLAYEGTTASDLVRLIAGEWGLPCGEIEETGYMIPGRVESGRPLLDMIQTALDLTAEQSGHLFALYDEAGSLRLTHVENMALDTLIHEGSIANFDYSSSIDRGSCSAVRLYRTEGAQGETVFHEARRESLLRRWGMLRHFGRLEEEADGTATAEALLRLFGRKTRHLRIVAAVGDRRVRGGSMLPVELYLGDIAVAEFLMVERVVHRFSEGGHTMDLVLVGGEFVD
ncbi:MAG: hydrolase [Oscillospiraceae bacterium]|nr:hydrolase [Oscillospiraceae bacterium]